MDIEISQLSKADGSSSEFLLMSVNNTCSLKDFLVMDSTYDKNKKLSNIDPHVFCFPDVDVEAGEFVCLFTSSGKYKVKIIDGESVHCFYWGSKAAIWNDDGDKAFLLKIGETQAFSG